MTDYAELIEPVVKLLRGEPNASMSKPDDLRYGTHGSLSVKLSTGAWHDHEAGVGGGVLDLIQHEGAASSRAEAHRWLVDHGLVQADAPARRGRPAAATEATYQYRDADGKLVFEVVRRAGKRFLQRRPDPAGKDGWTWNLQGVQRVLYRLPELLAAPVDSTAFVVEGEKDADRLRSLGLVATCNPGGAGKWRKEYSTPLKGRHVVVLPDNDDPGRAHAAAVLKALSGVAASVRVVELPGLPEKGDVSDWLDSGHTGQELLALVDQQKPEEPAGGGGKGEREPAQTDLLVEFVQKRFELAHDENSDGLAISKDTKEVFRLSGRAFRDNLLAGFYLEYEVAVRDASLREAMMTLQALARSTGAPRKINLRVAGGGDEYFIDLGKPGDSRAIRLMPGHWEITDRPRCLFIRGDSMMPLVEPISGGDVNLLWQIANIPEDQRILLLAWMVDCLRPDTPFPLLELIGEQGSGKSVASEAIRRVIDPNAANLRAEPKNAEDLFVIAHHNHIVALENVSRLTPQQQDAACILATGGGFAKRKLYSDSDEAVIVLRRPVLINGIVAAVTQQDLVDRCISIECPVLEGRLTSVEMWRAFERNLPSIMGGLLDLAAKALSILPDIQLPVTERPRLAEFALLGCAVAAAMGRDPQEFMGAFNVMRAETVGRTLEASPVAVAVQELIEAQPGGMAAPLKDILHALENYKPTGTDAWPRSAKGLGDALRRAAPALRSLGIEARSLGKIGSSVRWEIKQKKSGLPKEKKQNDVVHVVKVVQPEAASTTLTTSETSIDNFSSDHEVF